MEDESKVAVRSEAVPSAGFRELVGMLRDAGGGADFFVIGALARDLLLEVVHGVEVGRATRDVDVAIALGGWEAYEAVVEALTSEYGFERGDGAQRLNHPDRDSLDLVPFGDLENPPGAIEWPEEAPRVMSTLGLQEALAAATNIWLDGDLPVKVASLEGQALLKLIAWHERSHEREHDAEDFCLLLRSYYDIREELVFERHLDIFEERFNQSEASGRVYGREVATLLEEASDLEAAVLELLEKQTKSPETSDFARAMAGKPCFYRLEDRFRALEGFLRGLRERRRK